MEDGGAVGVLGLLAGAQGVLGVVEAGAGEPAGAGHHGVGEDGVGGLGEADVEPLGDGGPEAVEVLDRPGVQGCVAGGGLGVRGGGCERGGRGAVVLGGPGLEGHDPGAGGTLGVRAPERLVLGWGAHGGGLPAGDEGGRGRLWQGPRPVGGCRCRPCHVSGRGARVCPARPSLVRGG